VFPHLGSTDIPFSSYTLKDKYVELMGKDKGYNSSHAYCQVKGWFKKSYEIFSNDFEKDFKNGMMEEEKMDSREKILKLKCFPPLKILTSPFYLQRLLELFFFLPIFQYFLFLSFFSRLHLFEDFGILMINEEKNTLQKFLFRWNVMEWLSHDYGNGGVVDISVVDAYFRMELCTPILLDEPSKKFGWQIIFEKFQNSQWSHPLTKLNINKSCYVDSIWLW
jgi:hypothetical protein